MLKRTVLHYFNLLFLKVVTVDVWVLFTLLTLLFSDSIIYTYRYSYTCQLVHSVHVGTELPPFPHQPLSATTQRKWASHHPHEGRDSQASSGILHVWSSLLLAAACASAWWPAACGDVQCAHPNKQQCSLHRTRSFHGHRAHSGGATCLERCEENYKIKFYCCWVWVCSNTYLWSFDVPTSASWEWGN